ncbi:MAG: phytanoyl-CoA dioxygenase family protein [Planctomycetes bacterium]|nr:phytanoyl-CoA dioxygenase family protein [Planctomycetota bacterium]
MPIDDCPLENGPLMVLPGSHRHGYLAGDQKAAMAPGRGFVCWESGVGGCAEAIALARFWAC